MILLSHHPNNMFTLASTITQTVAVANFALKTVASRVLAEIDLRATRRPLASRISAVQSEESSANSTTVIRHGPPPQNQWKGQTNSYQRPPYQANQSGYQNQEGSGPAPQQRPNNQKGKGPVRAKNPSKQQKKSWYEQHKQQQQQQANPKGKGKANEVMFVNEVEMYNASVEEGETPPVFDEDDPLFRFIDHLEGEEGELMDVDEDTSSTVAHVGWDADGEEENNGAGPNQPFRHNSF